MAEHRLDGLDVGTGELLTDDVFESKAIASRKYVAYQRSSSMAAPLSLASGRA